MNNDKKKKILVAIIGGVLLLVTVISGLAAITGVIPKSSPEKDYLIKVNGTEVFVTQANKSPQINFSDGVLYIESIPFNEAIIKIPAPKDLPSITVGTPKLYYKQDEEKKFREAVPYCKGELLNFKCYNTITFAPGHLMFSVEHATSYNVTNETNGYHDLEPALFWKNGSYNTTLVVRESNRLYQLNHTHTFNRTDTDLTGAERVFDFQETSGTFVTDYSSLGIEGNLTGEYHLDTDGYFNSGLYFNGTNNGRINLTTHLNGFVTGNTTVMLFLNFTNNTANGYSNINTVISQIHYTTFAGVAMILTDKNKVQWTIIEAGAGASNHTEQELEEGEWNCIVGASEDLGGGERNLTLWVYNSKIGGLQDAQIADLPLTDTVAYVGDAFAGANVPLNGTIDELRVYNITLDDETIKQYCYGKLSEYRIAPPYQSAVIDIQAENITIDMNETPLYGLNNTDSLRSDGISSLGGLYPNVTVKKAILENFTRYPITLQGTGSTIENNTVKNCKCLGLGVTRETVIRDNWIEHIGNNTNITSAPLGGIYVFPDNSTVENNTIINSTHTGIYLVLADNTTIKNNIIEGTYPWAENVSDLLLGSAQVRENNIYLNHFLSASIRNLSTTPEQQNLCVGGEGNFYNSTLTVPSNDCGPVNQTVVEDNDVFWKRQTSFITPINYYVWINDTYQGEFNNNVTYADFPIGNYSIKIIPYINYSTVSRNATAYNGFVYLGLTEELIGAILAPFVLATLALGWTIKKLDEEHIILKAFYFINTQLFLLIGTVLLTNYFETQGLASAAEVTNIGSWVLGWTLIITFIYIAFYLLTKGLEALKWRKANKYE